jgi:hypothetical protein
MLVEIILIQVHLPTFEVILMQLVAKVAAAYELVVHNLHLVDVRVRVVYVRQYLFDLVLFVEEVVAVLV